VAAGAALLVGKAQAVTPVDLFDDRKARKTGFDLIYEARDLDLPQSTRDGLDQVCRRCRASLAGAWCWRRRAVRVCRAGR
jgi:hypothetical protein